jgi:hypothetical protein
MDMAIGVGIIWSAERRCFSAVGAPRRFARVGAGVLVVAALGAVPDANADPPPGCPQGPVPGPGPFPGCGNEGAFLADIGAAGFGDANGKPVALQQGRDICRLMDAGVSRQDMVNQFSASNPALVPDGAAQVVEIAIRDLCPWHR